MGPRLLAFAALCLLVPVAGAQQAAYYEQDGVQYYRAVGTVASGNVSTGLDYEGTQRLSFLGCAQAKLRPDLGHGRVQLGGRIDGVRFDVEVNQPAAPGGLDLGVATDVMVDGSRTHDGIQHPAVLATAAAWGPASIFAADVAMADPVTGRAHLDATMFVTATGFRDDETGRIRNADGSPYAPGDRAVRQAGDWEMHLRVESPGGAKQPAHERFYQVPQPVGPLPMYLPPSENHMQSFPIRNLRYGGNATIEVEATSQAMAGQNDLSFLVIDPTGKHVAQETGQPAMGAPFSSSLEFPLDRFGTYLLHVSGRVSLSEYSVRVVQETPESFDLNFWWEHVLFGSHANEAASQCDDLVDGRNEELSGSVVGRQPPPPFPWVPVVLTTMGAVATVLVAVVAALMARAADAHRQMLQG